MKSKRRAWIKNTVWMLLMLAVLCTLCSCAQEEQGGSRIPLQLTFRETAITIGAPVETLIGALGEDYTLMEAASCAGIGKDYVYTYPSLRLYVFAPENGVATVTSACYTDDGASHCGLTIGSSADAVLAAMGAPDEQTDSRITYRDEGVTLTFTLREGMVSAVVLAEE